MTTPCKHPIVKVVARQEDVEFVECQNCGDIFDSAEYEDMAVEEKEHLNLDREVDADAGENALEELSTLNGVRFTRG
ncbi:MAG: hypothetical protein NVSMB3_05080 [Acidobacteriaceae bacterium]